MKEILLKQATLIFLFYFITFVIFMILGFSDLIKYIHQDFMYWIGGLIMMVTFYIYDKVMLHKNTETKQ